MTNWNKKLIEFRQNLDGNKKRNLVLSTNTGDPLLLSIQAQALHKFLNIDFDYIVGFDFLDKGDKWSIHSTPKEEECLSIANKLDVKTILIPQEIHSKRETLFSESNYKSNNLDFALRCANSVQFLLSVIPWQTYESTLFIDGDLFPITEISKVPVSINSPIRGVKQVRSKRSQTSDYLWPGLFWIHSTLPFLQLFNWDLSKTRGVKTDVGGKLNEWIYAVQTFGFELSLIQHFPSLNWGYTDIPQDLLAPELVSWISQDYRNVSGKFFSELFDFKFLHYRGGGNWLLNDPSREISNRKLLLSAIQMVSK